MVYPTEGGERVSVTPPSSTHEALRRCLLEPESEPMDHLRRLRYLSQQWPGLVEAILGTLTDDERTAIEREARLWTVGTKPSRRPGR